MKIDTYKKLKGNQYEIILDNKSNYKLFDETIIKYNLITNKIISDELLKEILDYNNKLKAYYDSLKYLNRKMRSTLEIEKFLLKKDYSLLTIKKTITKLTKNGYLNDDTFVQSYINDQFFLTNNGPNKIKYNLSKLGIDTQNIEINKDFEEKIKCLIAKKIKLNKKLSTNALKLNIIKYLNNLGYPKEMFEYFLEDINAPDSELIKKEYELLCKKFANKYDEYKLESYIKDKLYKKGYSIEQINNIIHEKN